MQILGLLVAQTVITGVALWAAAYSLDGIHFDGSFLALMVVAVVFGVVNTLIRPIIFLVTLPLTIITLGLFALVLNALMLLLTGAISSTYSVDGLWPAFLGSIVISIVSTALHLILGFVLDTSIKNPARA